jgi:hypothetical protein
MRIPAFVTEHPVETLLAGVLLAVVLFGSADRKAIEASDPATQVAAAGRV